MLLCILFIQNACKDLPLYRFLPGMVKTGKQPINVCQAGINHTRKKIGVVKTAMDTIIILSGKELTTI